MYIPQESLANFNDASSPNANWTLNVSDGASGDIGNVEFIELVFIAPPACPAPNTLMTSNVYKYVAVNTLFIFQLKCRSLLYKMHFITFINQKQSLHSYLSY